MEQKDRKSIYQEDCEPTGRIIHSDVLLYVLVVLVAIGIIVGMCALQAKLGFPLIYGQIVAFALLLAFGYLIYRTRLITYRYSVTERMFSVDRVVGKKVKPEYSLHLADITSITEEAVLKTQPEKKHKPCHGDVSTLTVLLYKEGGKRAALYVQLSPEMRESLVTLWKAARK